MRIISGGRCVGPLSLICTVASVGACLGLTPSCATQGPDFAPTEFPGDERIRTNFLDDRSPPPTRPPASVQLTWDQRAASLESGTLCEASARSLNESKPEDAWALLSACIRKHDFTDLFRLTAAPWLQEIRRRDVDGLLVSSQVLAQRGGNLQIDIAHMNGEGIQLFDLEDALKNPRIFRGRHVLFRGRVLDERPIPGGHRLQVAETSLEAENVRDNFNGWTAQKELAKGRSGENLRVERRHGRDQIVVSSLNQATSTGREVILRGDRGPSPVAREREHLFLMKLESTRTDRAGEDADMEAEDVPPTRAFGTLIRVFRLGPPALPSRRP